MLCRSEIRDSRSLFVNMATKNKFHVFYDEINVGGDGFGKKKQCKLCDSKIDVSNGTEA